MQTHGNPTQTNASSTIPYGYAVTLAGTTFENAKDMIVAALQREGFGILTEIDVKKTLHAKLGAEFRKYVILGACNPQLAHRGLQAELPLGLLLPCNVCVWEVDGGATVAVLRPDTMAEMTRNPKVQPIADEADAKLRRALAALPNARA
jgi:uncharacterized protein (DUF302 family)